ncbi:hypothetical protein [uncultured Maricaulis sp.]|uniref:hypothetical protein n=1 Tax=uncultured Maricaulis sp. TaxID=174710 RepID=UPI0030D6CE67|tara:strand:- start:7249 stop:7401 length:153 start_codon:yes stop_codon:yes gene_type:complete
MMTCFDLIRFDMPRRTACGEGLLAASGSTLTTTMTITMTTSGTRGQVGVD